MGRMKSGALPQREMGRIKSGGAAAARKGKNKGKERYRKKKQAVEKAGELTQQAQ